MGAVLWGGDYGDGDGGGGGGGLMEGGWKGLVIHVFSFLSFWEGGFGTGLDEGRITRHMDVFCDAYTNSFNLFLIESHIDRPQCNFV